MKKILALNGSYRDGGITDQAINCMAQVIRAQGAEVEVINLRDYPVNFCLNCRECTQHPGASPGKCVQNDDMEMLISKIEQADGYILASPTNFGTVTAVFKRFMERLIVYAYWPWDANVPRLRKKDIPKKKAVLISSSAAPAFMGRYFCETLKQLRKTAVTMGANPVGTMFTGLIAKSPTPELPEKAKKKITVLVNKLI